MELFNSCDYNRGHRDGMADAQANKAHDYCKAGKNFKPGVYGNNAYDSYCEGYDDGYREGCEERE